MNDAWTVRRLLGWTAQHFERRGLDSPRLTAEVLLAHTLSVDRVRLYVDLDRPLEKTELAQFRSFVERRAGGEPTQYLTERREFYGRSFRVDARVLIPRPETELLVEKVLDHLPSSERAAVLDLCTGSGCIAVSLAAERPAWEVWATDASGEACALARHNAETLGVLERCHVITGDLFSGLPPGMQFHAVVSNPPYISSAELPTLSREVQREPRLALDGGPDGLAVMRRVVEGAFDALSPSGLLALEIGETQGEAVRALLRHGGFRDVQVEKDWEKRERLALAVRP